MIISSRLNTLVKRILPSDRGDFDKVSFSSNQSDKGKRAMVGGLIGGGAGAAVGAAIARTRAVNAYESSTESTEVTLDWEVPITRDDTIGQIPKDEKIWAGLLGLRPTRVNPNLRDVVTNNTVLGPDGQPQMQTETNTFTGHGEPNITWSEHSIDHKSLDGYNRSVTSRYSGQVFCRHNIFPPEGESLRQWCVDYRPRISSEQVGTYRTPSVHFERPDSVSKQLSQATLKGAGIGLVTGVALGVIGGLLTSDRSPA